MRFVKANVGNKKTGHCEERSDVAIRFLLLEKEMRIATPVCALVRNDSGESGTISLSNTDSYSYISAGRGKPLPYDKNDEAIDQVGLSESLSRPESKTSSKDSIADITP